MGLPPGPFGYVEHVMTDVDLRLPGDVTAAAVARRSLDGLSKKVSDKVFEDVRLLVTELITNSVRHAKLDGEADIHLRVAVRSDVVRVEVADAGKGFEPRGRNAPLTQASGWGLYLVEKLSDRWGVERDPRTRVWFEIDVPATA